MVGRRGSVECGWRRQSLWQVCKRRACLSSGGCSTSPSQADSYVVHDTAGKIEIFLDRCQETTVIECLILWWPPRPAPLLLHSCLDRIVESWSIVPPGQQSGDWRPNCQCSPAVGCHWDFTLQNLEICSVWLELNNECIAIMSGSCRQWELAELSDEIDTADCLVDWLCCRQLIT